MAGKHSRGQSSAPQQPAAGRQKSIGGVSDHPEFFRFNAQYLIAPGASFEDLYNDFTMLHDIGVDLLHEVAQEADSQKCWASFHLLSQARAIGGQLYREGGERAPAASEPVAAAHNPASDPGAQPWGTPEDKASGLARSDEVSKEFVDGCQLAVDLLHEAEHIDSLAASIEERDRDGLPQVNHVLPYLERLVVRPELAPGFAAVFSDLICQSGVPDSEMLRYAAVLAEGAASHAAEACDE